MNWKKTAAPFILLLIWCVLTEFGVVKTNILPSPLKVLIGLKDLAVLGMPPGNLLFNHIIFSLKRVISGYLIAVILAIPTGIAMGWYKGFGHFMEPLIEIFRPIPPLAWIPISILWFGIGLKSAAFIIFLGAFFPILLNTVSSVKEIDPLYIDVGRSLNAGTGSIIFKIVAPAATPGIITGMRIGIGIGWMSLVAAEFAGVKENYGLGYMIMTARDIQRTDQVLAGMLVIGVIGLFVDSCFQWVEKRFNKWR